MNKNNKRKKTVGLNKRSSAGFGDIDDDNDDLDDIFMASSNSIHHQKITKDASSDELPHKNSKTKKESTTSKNIAATKSKPKRVQTKQSKDNQPVARVPNPPKSLVQLLQKDTNVLKYFTALQQNLEYDVQTWKDKALNYRREYKLLQKKVLQQQEEDRLTSNIPKRGNENIDNDVVNHVHEEESSRLPIDTIQVTVPANTSISLNSFQHHYSQEDADQSSLSAPEDEQPSNDEIINNSATTKKNIPLAEDTLFDEFPSSSSSSASVNSNDSSHSINNKFIQTMEDEYNKRPKNDATKSDKTLKHAIDANHSHSPLNDNYNHDNDKQLDRKSNQTTTYTNILPLLIKAYDTLEQHGVWIVNVKYVKPKNTCIINKDTTTNHGHNEIGTNNHSFDTNEPRKDCTVQDYSDNKIDNSDARDKNDEHGLINEKTVVDFANPEYLDESDDSSDLPSSFLPSVSPRNRLPKLIPQHDTNHKEVLSLSSQNYSQIQDTSKINIGQDTSKINIGQDLDSSIHNNESVVFSRRSDADVITDLLRSIRSSIRLPTLEIMKINDKNMDSIVQNDIRSLFQPFISQKLIPCCYKYALKLISEQQHYMKSDDDENKQESIFNNVMHPAANSLHSLSQALAIIDLYCTENSLLSDEAHWNDLFDTSLSIHGSDYDNGSDYDDDMKTKLKKIKLGFRHRDIVEPLVQSLHGEISRYWSLVDRGARNTTSTLLYEHDDVEHVSSSSFDVDSLLDEDELILDTKNQVQSMDKEHTHESSSDKMDYSILFPCMLTPKIHTRLFTLVERIYHCRMVAYMYHFKHQTEELVRLIFEYILASAPVPSIEKIYPRFPPIMSMCILEALLGRPDETFLNSESSWFRNSLLRLSLQEDNSQSLTQSIAIIIHRSAALWSERMKSNDDRIRDMSKVEVAAYKRLLISESSWLNQEYEDDYELIVKTAMSSLSGMIDRISNADENDPIIAESSPSPKTVILSLTFQISLLCSGNIQMIQETYDKIYGYFRSMTRGVSLLHLAPVMTACIHAYSGIQMLQWESMTLKVMSSTHKIADFHIFKHIQMWIDQWLGTFVEEFKSTELHEDLSILYHILRCCLVISDAPRAHNIVTLMLQELHSQNNIDQPSVKRKITGILSEIKSIANIPTLRVINLEYRRDRLNSFMIQAQNARIMTALAISDLDLEVVSNDSSVWGSHAYDGRNVNHLEFENNWKNLQGSSNKRLADYVQTHWRPNDLKAFDIGARDDDALVRVSPTERACALSHISSWLGVKRSLDDFHYLNSEIKSRGLVETELVHNFTRLYKISGFARGKPLMVENEDMSPAPVCIIVEDDAVFVDRFTDILNQVLDELPRDFHFCSIGYGRPKTAPMVKYSEQIGIPSCLWYLSGYILSYEGAKYLLDSLPVIGPVDSWIGLKMTATWDNTFGHRIGVGHLTKVLIDHSQLPSRKDLQSIMKFRCFASITPLCSQKLGSSSTVSSSEKERESWRDRDTDITFSGRMTVTK